MSRFYSSIQGQRGEATRCGHSSIRASAQSFEGSVITELYRMGEDGVYARIVLSEGSSKYTSSGFVLYDGPLATLINQPARQTLMQAFINDTLTT